MIFKDKIKSRMFGEVLIKEEFNRKSNVVFYEKNAIMDSTSDVLCNLIMQSIYGIGVGGDYKISKLKFSDQGITGLTNVTTPVDTADTDLIGTSSVPVSFVSASVTNTENSSIITYEFYLPSDEGNTLLHFTEAGLFTENDILVAKKHFPSYQKTSERALRILWSWHFENTD